jgi:hypothetical protein
MNLTAEMPIPTVEQDPQATPTAAPESDPATREAVLLAVRRDCLLEPDLYLDEVRVPFGGE